MFDWEFAVSNREKTLAQREETFALDVVSFAAQRSDLETRLAAQQSEPETRSQGLAIRKQELDELSGTLAGWRKQLEERASKLAIAESELEEVSGKWLLQGPPEEEAAPLPQVLVRTGDR